MAEDTPHPISIERYRALFDTLYPPLCLFAKKYLGDIESSKDAVQEVFIKIWEQKILYINFSAMKSLLYKSVRNKCLDILKSKNHKMKSQSSDIDEAILMTDDFYLTQLTLVETYSHLETAIKKLPLKSQRIIRLGLNAYSNQEIADELCITKNTVKSQKRIAYDKIRHSLGSLLNIF